MKIILIFATVTCLLLSSCRFVEGKRTQGDGNLKKVQRSVTGFSGVETHGSIDIVVMPGDYKVEVESDANIIPDIVTEIVDNKLRVHFKDNNFESYSYTSATVYVTAPSLNDFEIHGSGNITGKGKLTATGNTGITIGGSGDVSLDLHTPEIQAQISGSGNITLAGETKDFSSEINGSGDLHAFDLKTENARIAVHGSGGSEISASVKLDAEIYGSGDVNYKGSPQVSSSIHGSGSMNQSD